MDEGDATALLGEAESELRGRARGHHEGGDLAQDCRLQLWIEIRAGVLTDAKAVRARAATLFQSASRGARRKRSRRGVDLRGPSSHIVARLEARERLRIVASRTLPSDRQLLELVGAGVSAREAALRLGCSEAAYRKRVARCRCERWNAATEG